MQHSNMPTWLQAIPPVTRNLIIINIIIWIAEWIPGFSGTLLDHLGLHYWGAPDFNPAQIITYCFLHSPRNLMHIGFNMFSLWMFGRFLEGIWGSKRFFIFYFVTAIGAAIVQELVWHFSWIGELAAYNHITTEQLTAYMEQNSAFMHEAMNSMLCIGASGAIFGILLGFAFVFPNMPLYIFFVPIPIKAKYMVIGYAVLELFLGVGGSGDMVAHFAHLGGMLFALPLLLYWHHKGTLRGNHYF